MSVRSNENDSMKLYEKSSKATQSLVSSIEAIVDHYTKVSMDSEMLDTNDNAQQIKKEQAAMMMNMLTLKQSQRKLGLLLAGRGGGDVSTTGGGNGSSSLSEKVSAKRSEVEHQALTLQNIIYEKNHLVNEIRACKQVPYPNLLKMAREELISTNTTDSAQDNTSGSERTPDDEEKIISQFLAPAKAKTENYIYHDASHHSYNLSKMHSELTTRGTLQSKLNKREKEKIKLVQELEKKQKFVSDLPKHVAALEKSAKSLQDYFLNVGPSAVGSGGEKDSNLEALQLGALDRKERFKLAMELRAPLYALFLQFQGYMDAKNGDEKSTKGGSGALELRVVDVTTTTTTDRDPSSEPTVTELVDLYTHKEAKALQLCIPIPSVDANVSANTRISSSSSTSSTKTVKIQFDYLDELKIIVAHVVKDRSMGSLWEDGTLLLQNLFQNDDDGRDIPCGSAADIMYQDADSDTNDSDDGNGNGSEDMDEDIEMGENDDDSPETDDSTIAMSPQQIALGKIRQSFQDNDDSIIVGRPYNWCQYLAGLNYPSKMNSSDSGDMSNHTNVNKNIESTTKAVLQQLRRRVQSHVTLASLIGKLKSVINPVPVHPSVRDSVHSEDIDTLSTKLVEFGEDVASINSIATSAHGKKYYAVIKRKTKTIKVLVHIDVRYPAVPPLWSLQESTTANEVSNLSSDDLPLFDSTLGQIESRVNSLDGDGMFFNDDIEDSFYWILMQQLHIIISEWTAYQSVLDPSTSNGGKNDRGVAGRKRKGRDRRPAATCFKLYRHGL